MKKLLYLFLALGLTLSACGTVSTQPAPPAQTGTPTLTPRATQTPTSTITPLPTIPTFTPTFDAATIVTVTPAEKAECPKEDPNLSFDSKTLVSKEGVWGLNIQTILDLLNKGAQSNKITESIHQELPRFNRNSWEQKDITSDGVKELIVSDNQGIYILGCENGAFQKYLGKSVDLPFLRYAAFNVENDLNLNGIPEVVMDFQGGHFTVENIILIFEWDGLNFSSLIQDGFAEVYFSSGPILQDFDNNQTIELMLRNTLPSPIPSRYAHLIPWRNETLIYSWNGEHFSESQIEFEAAKYLFQAIQDADQASKNGNHEIAQKLYQEAIFNIQLLPWSEEILENEIAKSFAQDGFRDMPPIVPPNPAEYPSLAAYAYYRIMLLHLVQGQQAEAASTYQILQDTFGSDPYAAPYIEMATAFWEAYQPTHKMYDGCAAAIQYTVEHPQILTPLGSDYHGWQSHTTYVPEDVCPFR